MATIRRGYRFRIQPNTEQLDMIWTNIHSARAVYNIMLADKIAYYEKTGSMLHNTPAQYKDEYPWLREADSLALANAQLHLEAAYKNFFRDIKTGFPKFKSRSHSVWAYTTSQVNGNITLGDDFLRLPKVGSVRIKQHRPVEGKIKSVTVEVTRTGKVFASILAEREADIETVGPRKVLGLDYSSPYLYIDSNGDEPDYEKPFRKHQDKLAKEQRKLSEMALRAKAAGRSLKDCRNYQKQRIKVARIHEKVANCRKDALHKLSRQLADNCDAVAVEDLNMRAMSQGLNLGRSTLDNGYGMFVTLLKYKLEEQGKRLITIDRWYPSTKTCSCCGNTRPMRLSDREYVCPECGLIIDRDVNAAINIRNEAMRMLKAA